MIASGTSDMLKAEADYALIRSGPSAVTPQ